MNCSTTQTGDLTARPFGRWGRHSGLMLMAICALLLMVGPARAALVFEINRTTQTVRLTGTGLTPTMGLNTANELQARFAGSFADAGAPSGVLPLPDALFTVSSPTAPSSNSQFQSFIVNFATDGVLLNYGEIHVGGAPPGQQITITPTAATASYSSLSAAQIAELESLDGLVIPIDLGSTPGGTFTVSVIGTPAVPEPSTLALLGSAMMGLLGWRCLRRSRKKAV